MPQTESTSESYVTGLLNRVEAIIDSGAGSITELAKFLLPEQDSRQAVTRVSEWVRSRQRTPNGETALRMQEWAAGKIVNITTGPGSKQRAADFRKAHAKIENERRKL